MDTKVVQAEQRKLIIVGLSVLILMSMISWSRDRIKINEVNRININSVVICKELDTQLRPVGEKNIFPEDSRQVCLWLRFSAAREGDRLQIAWVHKSRIIHKESIRLKEPEGIRAFYLVRSDGNFLPVGQYEVRIQANREKTTKLDFQIVPNNPK